MMFHENLSHLRKNRGLSQEELAARIHVSRQAVSKWETGDAAPDLDNLLALADALELSLDALCGREMPVPSEAKPAAPEKASLKSTRAALPVLLSLLAALIVIAVIRFGSDWRVSPAEESAVGGVLSTMSEEFTVSGVSFHSVSGNALGYRFTPNLSGEGLRYQISFADANGKVKTFDAECVGGICSGTAAFEENFGGYTVTVSVTDGVNSRNLAIAENLSFSANRSSWNDLAD